jgi:peptidoglycan/LPS O-acetylase OafA/YrhL
LRFSRLYPLHLATLLAVAAEQTLFLHLTGRYFVYGGNDGYHFLLNLGMASSWGFERGLSFNAPVWSVSVEVALYVIFFVVCRLMRARLVSLLALVALGFLGVGQLYWPIGKGLGGFFLGGCMYLTYEWILRRGFDKALARVLSVLIGAAWVYVLLPGSAARLGVAGWRPPNVEDYWPVVIVLFPFTILTLVLVETRRGTFGRRLSFIGDLSYSSYLLHFPLQLAVAILVVVVSADRAILFSRAFFVWFFALLILASLASYHWFEAPAQRWIRTRLIRRGAGARVAVATTRASGSGDSSGASRAGSP